MRGRTWYDYSVGGLRQDFLQGKCPFIEVQPPLSKYVPFPCACVCIGCVSCWGWGVSPCVNDRGWVCCALSSVLCSMLFLRNYNYYIYLPNGTSFPPIGTPLPPPVAAATTCCKYHFPVWAPDSYRVANASFGGTTPSTA